MPATRWVLLVAAGATTFGSLGLTGGYAWYLRSDRYRRACAAYLSSALDLPSDIGRVVPRSRRAREFDDVVVWLSGRRGRALTCRRALVVQTPRQDDPDAYEIELVGGTCEISTRTWLRADYRSVVESGLRPGFAPGGPRRVSFSQMDLTVVRGDFAAALRSAAGKIRFARPDAGQALVYCRNFNGYESDQPVYLAATFSPQHSGVRIDHLELRVPRLPLRSVGLKALVGAPVRSGQFCGRLVYQETADGQRVTVSGQCFGLQLPEVTASLLARPWRGRCPQIELRELRVENGTPLRLRFAGVVTGLVLGDILAPWGLAQVGGALTLRVGDAELSRAGIQRFVASGQCSGLSLAKLTAASGWGRMTGNLRLTIDDLTISDNRLESLDATLLVDPATDPPHRIEGRLLRELLRRALRLPLPDVLPEYIEYTRLGLRLDVRDEVLHVFGTHGPRQTTILTVRIGGQDLPLLREPQRSFDLSHWLDRLRAQAADRLQRHLRPASGPAGTRADHDARRPGAGR